MRDGELSEKISIDGVESEIRKFFDLKLLVINDYKEGIEKYIEEAAKKHNVDCIKIKNYRERIPGYYYKPKRLVYWQDLSDIPEDYLSSLSKKHRRRIKKALEKGFKAQVEFPISKSSFEIWYNLYKEKISRKNKGIEYIGKDFLEKGKGKKIGLFVYYKSEIIGGYIMMEKSLIDKADGQENEKYISTGYGGYDKAYLKDSINHFMMFSFIDFARKKYRIASTGKDTNFYGHHLSPGIFIFKKEWGFVPEPDKDFENFRIMKAEKFEDLFLFFSGRESPTLNLFFKKRIDNKTADMYRNDKLYSLKEKEFA